MVALINKVSLSHNRTPFNGESLWVQFSKRMPLFKRGSIDSCAYLEKVRLNDNYIHVDGFNIAWNYVQK